MSATGLVRPVVVPLPSWPLVLRPQQRTVPPERRAQVELPPALIALTLVRVTPAEARTGTGLVRGSSSRRRPGRWC